MLNRPPTLGAVVLSVVSAAALVGCTSQGPAASEPATTNHASAATTGVLRLPFTVERVTELRGDLESGDAAHVQDAVAVPVGKTLPSRALTELKALGPVTFDRGTFADRRDGTATVTAKAGGKTWTVFLVQQDGRWLISVTSGTS
jgi:hypothetical protein